MHELAISPQGHLYLWPSQDVSSEVNVSQALLDAFIGSPAQGMLYAACQEADVELPLSFEFARSIAQLYLTELCRVTLGDPNGPIPELPAPQAELEHAVLQAPPMRGLEYLNSDLLVEWWRELDALVRREIGQHPGGAPGYLRERNTQWRFVGRVTLHLAENKRDPQYPFAFLATFANGLTAQGRVKHEPLGRALEQYAGKRNREAMLNLLLPVSRAAASSPWFRTLVDSGQIYHPLAWTPREAYSFLKEVSLFESSGLIVRVPDWWNPRKPTRPMVNVKIDSKTTERIDANAILDFQVNLCLDGELLNPHEITELLESSNRLVLLRGKWVEVDRDKLKQVLDHWKRVERSVKKDGISFFDGMRLLSGTTLAEAAQAEHQETIRQWTGLSPGEQLERVLQGLSSPETKALSVPQQLRAELRPYQLTGYGWLRFVARLGLGGCLADDMGLGKTVQVISLFLDLKRENRRKASLLVVPASLIANWKSELAKFAPSLSFAVVHPSEVNASAGPIGAADADRFDLVITTYGMLVRTGWISRHPWRVAVLDEAQAIKNSGSKQARATKELEAESRIAMTGTPIENRLSDLWSLFDFLNPGLLGTAKEFSSFVKRLQNAAKPSFEPLRNLVRPYILRRLKTDKKVIADLPDKTEVNAYCSLSKHQAALYLNAVEELAQQIRTVEGIQRRGIVLAQLMRLKQICNHPAQATGTNDYAAEQSGKFRRLAEIAEEIASRQEKVLVFTQFREISGPLAEFLATVFGQPGLVLHGGTSIKQRKAIVEQFQRENGPPFFVLSLKAGGTGLNLTSAAHVIHFDRWWNPAIENQATDRAFRIGQMKNVMVHKFICRGTVEERIDAMIAEKSQVADEVIRGENSGEVLLTELDNSSLLELIRLDLRQMTEN